MFATAAVTAVTTGVLPDVTVIVALLPLETPVTPELLEVPAPIRLLTSAAEIFELRLGSAPSDKIAGVPVSLTTPRFVLAAAAVLAPVPPFAIAKSPSDTE